MSLIASAFLGKQLKYEASKTFLKVIGMFHRFDWTYLAPREILNGWLTNVFQFAFPPLPKITLARSVIEFFIQGTSKSFNDLIQF